MLIRKPHIAGVTPNTGKSPSRPKGSREYCKGTADSDSKAASTSDLAAYLLGSWRRRLLL